MSTSGAQKLLVGPLRWDSRCSFDHATTCSASRQYHHRDRAARYSSWRSPKRIGPHSASRPVLHLDGSVEGTGSDASNAVQQALQSEAAAGTLETTRPAYDRLGLLDE